MKTTMTRKQLISEMATALIKHYDAITKLSALKWLRIYFPGSTLNSRLEAYKAAYEN